MSSFQPRSSKTQIDKFIVMDENQKVDVLLKKWKKNFFDNCYFCLTNTEGYSKKKKKYPTIQSVLPPVLHGKDLPIPTPTLNCKDINILEMSDISDTSDENGDISEKTSDPTFKLETSSEPHLIRQNELNNLVRELCLSKPQAELLGSRLQE
ncbi:hypothetical protein AVEN_201623-1 [Araneus ventricosus]|uniref:Uncharacterized protein n=1 Tax=Araneus ventricosus TaxID=182803 RepID=A0A4Y2SS27_ARAVE|nr:hypothetical protein AVEN_15249-1 [Araneus ventricosus]GBN90473.1 hypothetical protein AVEN_201623-1 [Araneus ventricosus]